MGETSKLPISIEIFTICRFSSNLPLARGFLILDAKLAVSGTATSRNGLAGMIGI